MPVPISLELDLSDVSLAASTGTGVHFAVAEALANVIKHSGASAADVRADVDGRVLHVEVVDDGHGGADLRRGTGLQGISDRLSSLGGTLHHSSQALQDLVRHGW